MKSFFIIIVLLFTPYVNAQGQNVDDILKECQEKREHDRMVLDNYRKRHKYIGQEEIFCGNQFITFKYIEDSLYLKLQGKGIMPDSSMQVRILQLLNNEFYEGELEKLINDELKSDKYSGLPDSVLSIKKIELKEIYSSELPRYKKHMLIKACELLDNKLILKRIEELYKDSKYADLKKELLDCLLLGRVEPYTTDCLRDSKYKPCLSGEEQFYNIKHLEYIYTQESFREIAEYLFSKAYWEDHIMDDISLIDTINSLQESDRIIEDFEEDFELILEDDIIPKHHEKIRYNYYYAYAFRIIESAISNDGFYAMLAKLDINSEVEDTLLTLEKRRQIYRWMKKNYGKYKLRKRWK
ncbi:MAG: hypothetical protein MJZ01_07730 [Bacteroidales bacterium]|nr:hypothetical protein [Bacteroidales bacterium]